jgi:hypothetical protein
MTHIMSETIFNVSVHPVPIESGYPFGMNQVERLRLIQDYLSRVDFVSREDLCARLGASRTTVRRDLIELERKRMIRRVHGGAMSTITREDALDFRQLSGSCREEKMRIGKAAAKLSRLPGSFGIAGKRRSPSPAATSIRASAFNSDRFANGCFKVFQQILR